ncbi:MAG: hypothetical protein JSV12_01960 [Candidatus Bathyarchaeota archaeon]|nr:MAG: hypothetical protein JSV12_01960 [Candidatus Bathyarchaeota archaeon]
MVKIFQADTITVDGLDASNKLIIMLVAGSLTQLCWQSLFCRLQLGEPPMVFEEFGKPVVVISRTKPDNVQ